MSAPIVSKETLRRALLRLGWSEVGSFRNVLQYWEPDRSRGTEQPELERVIIPIDETASDAADLVEEAISYLGQRYGQEFDQTIEMIELMLVRHLDEVEVRRETGNSAGLIEWQLGNEAVASTRDILSAAAKAAASKRKRYFNSESIISDEFLSQCFMGQTKVGSYVVTALTPAEVSLATSRSEKDQARHPRIEGRMVTETLAESLVAVKDAIAEVRSSGGQVEAFELAVASGVSFELLSALEPLTRSRESGIQIAYFRTDLEDFSHAPVRQSIEVAFTPEDGRVIGRAREYFEAAPEPALARVTGEVTNLKNSTAGSEHQIKLAARINGKPKMVTVELTADQYDEAVTAHGQKRLFTVVGELESRQRGAFVHSAEKVRVEEALVSDIGIRSRPDRTSALPPTMFD